MEGLAEVRLAVAAAMLRMVAAPAGLVISRLEPILRRISAGRGFELRSTLEWVPWHYLLSRCTSIEHNSKYT